MLNKRGFMWVFFLSLFLICSSLFISGQEEKIYLRNDLDLQLTIENEMQIVPKSSSYEIVEAKAYLTFKPVNNEMQNVLKVQTSPEAETSGEELIFSWEKFPTNTLKYSVVSDIKTYQLLKKVKTVETFPVKKLPAEYKEYLDESESVDYKNERIMSLAQTIAAGETDQYVVVHNFAKWVNENIEYDLNTQTAEASKKASWVIDNGIGVCDELTNLFIALNRAVGIPARFVSGIAYTNDPRFTEKWGPHGWAEVYFPNYGWVPFDVTYGEFGYVDPAHIKLKDSVDANKSSTRYEWRARNVDIDIGQLKITTELKSMGDVISPLLDVKAKVAKPEVSEGSYNAFEVTLINKHDYYIASEILLSRTEGITMFDDYRQFALVKPNSEKKLYYIFKVDADFDKNYLYTFKMDALTTRGAGDTSAFTGSTKSPTYSLNEIRNYIDSRQEEDGKSYSKDISLDCKSKNRNYIVSEIADISCTIQNSGNVALENIEICFVNDCQTKSLGISQQFSFDYKTALNTVGEKKYYIMAENDEISKEAEVVINVFEKPEIAINNVTFPDEINLGDDFAIEFNLERANNAPIDAISAEVKNHGIYYRWEDFSLESKKHFKLNVGKNSLTDVENQIVLAIEFNDSSGQRHLVEKEFNIVLQEPSASQKMILMMNKISNFFMTHKIETLIILIGGFGMFIFVIKMIFRKKDFVDLEKKM